MQSFFAYPLNSPPHGFEYLSESSSDRAFTEMGSFLVTWVTANFGRPIMAIEATLEPDQS